jgi:hypothetical protein
MFLLPPNPCGSGFLVHPGLGSPVGAQGSRKGADWGEEGHSLTRGLEAMDWLLWPVAGGPHLQRGVSLAVMGTGGAGKGRQEAAAAAEQLLNYSDRVPPPATLPALVSPLSCSPVSAFLGSRG